MVVEVRYYCEDVACKGFYKLDRDLSKNNVELMLENYFTDMSFDTGLKYELISFEIITKTLIEI